ncbi:HNH endonuclease [Arthrobacter crystallopoietes BAB-32]|uniref:HNH endonuclease n=1 Tax=Arthrobacter crystallopoietes BAB-32 TaxID=1246476 RepID=N1V1I6_9MICC|nr:HNH endonuclease signature motif containing protein [Arthrobacter crystallopoietes]EMY33849.1 HNH endonuclease [Arthrobacter crystallopoietes BAB-32]
MGIAPLEAPQETTGFLASARDSLRDFAASFRQEAILGAPQETAERAALIEELSRTIEQLQVTAAHAVDQQDLATVLGKDPDNPDSKSEFRDTADYLRTRLRISRSEANRRIRLGASTIPQALISGGEAPPKYEHLAAGLAESEIDGKAATLILDTLDRVRPVASPDDFAAMEQQLTRQAAESDLDTLRIITKNWEAAIDSDGREPSTEQLAAQQGVFIKRKRWGLNRFEVVATDEQYEHLITAMNTHTNPRLRKTFAAEGEPVSAEDTCSEDEGRPAPNWPMPTRPQLLLQGLVGSCQIALSTDELPASGGHRPQVMVNIDYQELVSQIGTSGQAVFGGMVTPQTVRKIACDADLIPIVLGGKGEVLDVGRAQRLFTPAQRRALVARDKGCAFPGCTMPAHWTEAHHIRFWKKHKGRTSVANGVLLCSFHHHLVHAEDWTIESIDGIPWFIPPAYIDPSQVPRRNRYRFPPALKRASQLTAPTPQAPPKDSPPLAIEGSAPFDGWPLQPEQPPW